MKVKSFAKINLGLEIIKKRSDGYHEIRTIFQSINLFDVLLFQTIAEDRIELSGDNPSLSWDQTNLIFQAALLLKKKLTPSQGIQIEVKKNIPHGKGLGGGSSNAAVTLLALKKLWNLPLEKKSLIEYAQLLGADVPYFLFGGRTLGVGRGDTIRPLDDDPPCWLALILPEFSISTHYMYNCWDELSLTSPSKQSKIEAFLKKEREGSLKNDLEEAVFIHYPQLKNFKQMLYEQGAEQALVSGTGSAVFGIFREPHKARQAATSFQAKGIECRILTTLPRKDYKAELKDIYF